MCHIAHSYAWNASCICVTWLIRMCDMPHSYVLYASFIRVTRLIHMCDVTHSYMWRDSFTCVMRLIHSSIMSTYMYAYIQTLLVAYIYVCIYTDYWLHIDIILLHMFHVYIRTRMNTRHPLLTAATRSATHCITLQHIATPCNTQKYTAPQYNTLQYSARLCQTLQHHVTHCNSLQHTAA